MLGSVQPTEFTRLVQAVEAKLQQGLPSDDPGPGLSRRELTFLLASWLLARGTRKERRYGER